MALPDRCLHDERTLLSDPAFGNLVAAGPEVAPSCRSVTLASAPTQAADDLVEPRLLGLQTHDGVPDGEAAKQGIVRRAATGFRGLEFVRLLKQRPEPGQLG